MALEAFFEVLDGTDGEAEFSGEGVGIGDAGTEIEEEGCKAALGVEEREESGLCAGGGRSGFRGRGGRLRVCTRGRAVPGWR